MDLSTTKSKIKNKIFQSLGIEHKLSSISSENTQIERAYVYHNENIIQNNAQNDVQNAVQNNIINSGQNSAKNEAQNNVQNSAQNISMIIEMSGAQLKIFMFLKKIIDKNNNVSPPICISFIRRELKMKKNTVLGSIRRLEQSGKIKTIESKTGRNGWRRYKVI